MHGILVSQVDRANLPMIVPVLSGPQAGKQIPAQRSCCVPEVVSGFDGVRKSGRSDTDLLLQETSVEHRRSWPVMADPGSDDAEARAYQLRITRLRSRWSVVVYVFSICCPSVGIRARRAARFEQHTEADQSWYRRHCNSNRCSDHLTVCTGVCQLIDVLWESSACG